MKWGYSDYYDDEIPPPLFRNFIFFEKIIDTAHITDVKLAAIEVEMKFSENGRRRINIDPGYLTLAKVVLSSKKNYSHRISLGRGVFAELELYYKDGKFHDMYYTYPDYKDECVMGYLVKARNMLKTKLQQS